MLNDEIYQQMSKEVPKREDVIRTELQILEEDISFDVYSDIYKIEDENYLYIKMEENSAVAPFFYNKCFSKNDLEKIHDIFKSINMENFKAHLKTLFDKKRVKISFDENKGKDIIIMKLIISYFATDYEIHFDLFKQMIPEEEKDSQLINLYTINKKKAKIAKNLFRYLKNENNIDKQILDELKATFNLIEEPFTFREEDLKILKNIFGKKRKKFLEKEGYHISLSIKNKSEFTLKEGSVEFKLDENKSNIKCKKIDYPTYEIANNQDGDFDFFFDGNLKPGEYSCFFDVFINGTKLDNTKFELHVIVKQNK